MAKLWITFALTLVGQAGPASFASNRAELERVLLTVLDGIGRPIAPQAIAVILDGRNVPRGPQTWDIIGNSVVLNDAFCDSNASRALEIAVASRP
jgi:hypothetical protein